MRTPVAGSVQSRRSQTRAAGVTGSGFGAAVGGGVVGGGVVGAGAGGRVQVCPKCRVESEVGSKHCQNCGYSFFG
jgi:hypothetical protein